MEGSCHFYNKGKCCDICICCKNAAIFHLFLCFSHFSRLYLQNSTVRLINVTEVKTSTRKLVPYSAKQRDRLILCSLFTAVH